MLAHCSINLFVEGVVRIYTIPTSKSIKMDENQQNYGKEFETWHIRLKKIMDTLELNQTSFAAKIGVGATTVNNLLSRPVKAQMGFFISLKQAYPYINLNYLFVNQGDMFVGGITEENVKVYLAKEPSVEYNNALVAMHEELTALKTITSELLEEYRKK